MNRSSRSALPLIDLGKAVASQLIVWHHLAIYSPLRAAVDPLAPDLFAWLANPARMAVQVFLVMAGFLAARSLLPTPGAPHTLRWRELPGKLVQRYRRLMPPCAVAMVLAVAGAAAARALGSDDPSVPGAPTATQLLANALLLQDIVGEEALSAGLWYVAIDLQLFAMLLVVLALRSLLPAAQRPIGTLLLVTGCCAASWWGVNRDAAWDAWAPYFFGAYGAGLLAGWVRGLPTSTTASRRWLARAGLAALVAMALWLEWRERVLLAGACALLLSLRWDGPTRRPRPAALLAWAAQLPPVAWLARVSYSVFLAHYPVCLLVGALVSLQFPEPDPWRHGLGLLAAWGCSLLAGWALHTLVEKPALAGGRTRAAAARLMQTRTA